MDDNARRNAPSQDERAAARREAARLAVEREARLSAPPKGPDIYSQVCVQASRFWGEVPALPSGEETS